MLQTSAHPAQTRSARAGRWILGAWLMAASLLGASLMALHAPLPLTGPPAGAPGDRYVLLHALDMQCPCSRRVLDDLTRRGARGGVTERVLLVDGDDETASRVRSGGFLVEALDGQALAARYHIEAVPLLVILRPDGSVAYTGAHAPRPQMPPADLALLEQVQSGDHPSPWPVLGCATSRELQRQRDPLGLKYSLWR